MNDLKLGTKTFTGIDRVQINKADSSGVVNFMESNVFNSVLGGASGGDYYENPYLTTLGIWGVQYAARFSTVYLENVEQLANQSVGATYLSCTNFIAPKLRSVANQFTWNSSVKVVDFTALTEVGTYGFSGSRLEAIILRGNTVPTVGNVNMQSSHKPTVYVPSSMLSAYNADSSWASLVSTKEWTIAALEGSQYENPNWFKS